MGDLGSETKSIYIVINIYKTYTFPNTTHESVVSVGSMGELGPLIAS